MYKFICNISHLYSSLPRVRSNKRMYRGKVIEQEKTET